MPSELEELRQVLIKKDFQEKTVMDPDSRRLKSAYESFVSDDGYDVNNRFLFFYSGYGYSSNNGIKGIWYHRCAKSKPGYEKLQMKKPHYDRSSGPFL